MDWLMIVLRLIHIAGGVFWAGAVFINEGFLLPTMKATGPAGAPFMRHLMGVQQYSVRIATAGFLVILSGLGMYWRNGSVSSGAFYRSRLGMTLGLGGLTAIIALTIGLAFILPATKKMAAIGNAIQSGGGAPTPDQASTMSAMQQRVATGSHMVAGLIGLTVITMAIGRYV
jgi:hypothetical protein